MQEQSGDQTVYHYSAKVPVFGKTEFFKASRNVSKDHWFYIVTKKQFGVDYVQEYVDTMLGAHESARKYLNDMIVNVTGYRPRGKVTVVKQENFNPILIPDENKMCLTMLSRK